MSAKKTVKISAYTLIAVIIITLIALPKILKTESKGSPSSGKGGPVPVDIKIASGETLENTLKVNGEALPNEEISVRSEIAGKLVSINFREGSRVSAGALLAKINDSELQAELKIRETELELLASQEKRQKMLLEINGISREEYDAALSGMKTKEAEIGLLKAKIEKTEIRAPFAGTIGLRQASPGAFVSPDTEIAILQSTSPVKIQFTAPQHYHRAIKKGSSVNFSLPGSSQKFSAEIYALEPQLNRNTRSLKARAKYANKEGIIIPGSYVEIEIPLGAAESAIMIPTEALAPDIEGEKVYVFKDGKATVRKVKTGARTAKSIQLIEGVSPGDSIIVSGIINLRPGAPVRIKSVN